MGDTYTGKVVKTTQFGAFVELKKGTDGLLHVSNVGPGRVGHIEDVMARGDVLDVIVQEVDKERGRIGLKLVAKHENGEPRPARGADRAGEGRAAAASARSGRRAATATAAAVAAAAAVVAAADATAEELSRSGAPALVEARQQALLIAALRGWRRRGRRRRLDPARVEHQGPASGLAIFGAAARAALDLRRRPAGEVERQFAESPSRLPPTLRCSSAGTALAEAATRARSGSTALTAIALWPQPARSRRSSPGSWRAWPRCRSWASSRLTALDARSAVAVLIDYKPEPRLRGSAVTHDVDRRPRGARRRRPGARGAAAARRGLLASSASAGRATRCAAARGLRALARRSSSRRSRPAAASSSPRSRTSSRASSAGTSASACTRSRS